MDLKLILKRFCSKDDNRPAISKPFSQGEYTYATDANVLIRVPKIIDIPEVENSPNAEELFKTEEPKEYFNLPEELNNPTYKVCEQCKGKKSAECHECKGMGILEFDSDYNYYEVTCQTCDGLAYSECDKCNGKGKILIPKHFKIGEGFFSAEYLLLCRIYLLNCKIGPCGKFKSAKIMFDGGEGLLMTMRPPEGTE